MMIATLLVILCVVLYLVVGLLSVGLLTGIAWAETKDPTITPSEDMGSALVLFWPILWVAGLVFLAVLGLERVPWPELGWVTKSAAWLVRAGTIAGRWLYETLDAVLGHKQGAGNAGK